VSAPALGGDWSGLVVFCAATSWDGNRFPDQHMAERLARHAPVLYVDPPLSVLAPWREPALAHGLRGPRLRRIGPGLARLIPVGPPGRGRPGLRVLADQARRLGLRWALRRLGRPPVQAVVAASFAPVFGLCGERRRVFYSTDDFVAGADLIKVDRAALERDEARTLAAVDTVVVCSPGLEERYRSLGADPVLVPNGCDDVLFASTDSAPWPPDVTLPPPVAGFIGHLTDRIDLALLEAVAARGRSLLLVGPPSPSFDTSRLRALLHRPNVQAVGRKEFAELPSYLRAMDVGLLPYGDTAFNRASFPLKVLEYLAGGRAAVSTGLPVVRWLDTDLIDVADTPDAFADAVDRAIERGRPPNLVAARQAFARRHGWDRRAEEMAAAIGLPVP
jgi:glycosyltransferase involved in cell wall biosynthesis